MAIGFPASYSVTQAMPFDRFSIERLVEQALTALDWEVIEWSNGRFLAKVPFSALSWGERLSIEVGDHQSIIKSVCHSFQIIDWGKNRQNVEIFIAALSKAQRASDLRGDAAPSEIYDKGESVVERMVSERIISQD